MDLGFWNFLAGQKEKNPEGPKVQDLEGPKV